MKRLIAFISICILFIVIGIVETDNITFLSVMILPFSLVGRLLREMSLIGVFTNFLSMILFICITLLPIVFLVYKIYKKKISVFEYGLLPVLSFVLGKTLYSFINPHTLYDGLNPLVRDITPILDIPNLEVILTSGVAYIFYILLTIYIFSLAYVNKKFDSMKYFKILIDIIVILYAFSVLSISLSNLISSYQEITVLEEQNVLVIKYIGEVLISGLLIFLFIVFRGFIVELEKDGFQESLLKTLKKLYDNSFILLIMTLVVQGTINLYQFMELDKLMNIRFSFDIPISTILVVSIIFILSRYITRVIELKKENELII